MITIILYHACESDLLDMLLIIWQVRDRVGVVVDYPLLHQFNFRK